MSSAADVVIRLNEVPFCHMEKIYHINKSDTMYKECDLHIIFSRQDIKSTKKHD